mmetsp:Transcript_84847/g.238803  ORF Transcript_84847/g.238803 Transcript_84847/m.238803 type:complete len:220 (+) Transcript_84847:1022-1681(+)
MLAHAMVAMTAMLAAVLAAVHVVVGQVGRRRRRRLVRLPCAACHLPMALATAAARLVIALVVDIEHSALATVVRPPLPAAAATAAATTKSAVASSAASALVACPAAPAAGAFEAPRLWLLPPGLLLLLLVLELHSGRSGEGGPSSRKAARLVLCAARRPLASHVALRPQQAAPRTPRPVLGGPSRRRVGAQPVRWWRAIQGWPGKRATPRHHSRALLAA